MIDADRYLARIGYRDAVRIDRYTLERLQRAHLTAVAFENLDVFHRLGVSTAIDWSVPKIVERRRGGWCFEVNGAFGALLAAVGFPVRYLGAAVLLDGPSDVIDHLTLEVTVDEPYLVDVGFGDGFITPLALHEKGPQDGGSGTFQLIPSPKGTTLTELVDGLPVPQYRFTRVARELADFTAASAHLQTAEGLHWTRWPFATRLLDGGPDRVTLLADKLKIRRSQDTTETPVSPEGWNGALSSWFDMTVPTPPDEGSSGGAEPAH